jgi:hypothetical protein
MNSVVSQPPTIALAIAAESERESADGTSSSSSSTARAGDAGSRAPASLRKVSASEVIRKPRKPAARRAAGFEITDCNLKRAVRRVWHSERNGRSNRGGEFARADPLPAIQKRIVVVRKRHVMVDEDLAELYGVQTGRLIQQVKRNIDRFPSDFMFQLTRDEATALRSQSATSSDGTAGVATRPTSSQSRAWRCYPVFSAARRR